MIFISLLGDSFKHVFMPNLETLDLGLNMSVTDEVASYFNTCFPALKDLCLEGKKMASFCVSKLIF